MRFNYKGPAMTMCKPVPRTTPVWKGRMLRETIKLSDDHEPMRINEVYMRTILRILVLLGAAVILPSVASAQVALAGTVRDASGLILPGVVVEASSPALIEKTRAATTDAGGQYRI